VAAFPAGRGGKRAGDAKQGLQAPWRQRIATQIHRPADAAEIDPAGHGVSFHAAVFCAGRRGIGYATDHRPALVATVRR
jgi:hypothetical protein